MGSDVGVWRAQRERARLREDEDAPLLLAELGQQLVDQHHLPRARHQLLAERRLLGGARVDARLRQNLMGESRGGYGKTGGVTRLRQNLRLGALDEERVVAALAQFHHDVHQRRRRRPPLHREEGDVALVDRTVPVVEGGAG